MSSRSFELSAEAKADIRDILRYTQREWGLDQRKRFEQTLSRALLDVRAYPELGRAREDLGADMRMRIVGQHVITTW
jgi:plasmid stabilization system protein ParE